jgi:hypothetical protein
MYIQSYIVALSTKLCCHTNSTNISLLTADVIVAVNNTKVCSVTTERVNGFSSHICQVTRYFVLLLIVMS